MRFLTSSDEGKRHETPALSGVVSGFGHDSGTRPEGPGLARAALGLAVEVATWDTLEAWAIAAEADHG